MREGYPAVIHSFGRARVWVGGVAALVWCGWGSVRLDGIRWGGRVGLGGLGWVGEDLAMWGAWRGLGPQNTFAAEHV